MPPGVEAMAAAHHEPQYADEKASSEEIEQRGLDDGYNETDV